MYIIYILMLPFTPSTYTCGIYINSYYYMYALYRCRARSTEIYRCLFLMKFFFVFFCSSSVESSRCYNIVKDVNEMKHVRERMSEREKEREKQGEKEETDGNRCVYQFVVYYFYSLMF